MGGIQLPEIKYHPEKGLNVNLDPQMLQQLMQMLQGQQERPGQPPQQQPMIPPPPQRRM